MCYFLMFVSVIVLWFILSYSHVMAVINKKLSCSSDYLNYVKHTKSNAIIIAFNKKIVESFTIRRKSYRVFHLRKVSLFLL